MAKTSKEEAPPTNINELMDKINSRYGKGSIMAADEAPMEVEAISTGSLSLDNALGVGGIPRGRVTEIYGPESSGKSTLAMHVVAEAQKSGAVCAYIDAEHAMDPEYAAAIGVDINALLISQPQHGEQAMEILRILVKDGLVGLVVIDSVDALLPEAALKGEVGDSNVGALARLMSRSLRLITHDIAKTNTAVIFINQIREKIGVMFGSPETTSGGRALKFYSSVRLDIRRTATNTEGNESVSNSVKVKVVKNKVAPPYKIAEFDIVFGVGIDQYEDMLDVGESAGVLQKQHNTWLYEGVKLGGSRSAARDALEADPETAALVRKSIRETLWGENNG